MIKKSRLIKTLQALIRIHSENPGGSEKDIAAWVAAYLSRLGIASRQHVFQKGRPNVIARLKGSGAVRKSLLITPHLDTVPAGKGWRHDPFTGHVSGGRIYGLGSTDCKCNIAVALETIHSLREDNVTLGYDLVFAATADEESGSVHGLIPLIQKGLLRVDAAVVLDADDFEVIVAQKGLVHLKLTMRGRRAHGAYPWLGVNAIDQMSGFLSRLRDYRFKKTKKNPYLRMPTINVGTIRGGDKVNIVAGWCSCELDVRYLPGMSAHKIIADIRRLARAFSKHVSVEIGDIQKPYEIDRSHPLVTAYLDALGACAKPRRVHGSEGATVITFFQDRGIPAIATGFGCSGRAHMVDEYALVKNVYTGGKILDKFLRTLMFKRP
ncbi:MAG: M20 family metallopeptidase [Candidatus Omnitrophota bacterium]